MKDCVLVTGGAGFIGCAVSARLPADGRDLVVVDVLHPQVHPRQVRPAALHARAKLMAADVSEPSTWDELLRAHRPSVILHLAAETGTGQSLTEASRHATANVLGLTRMLDALSQRNMLPEHVVLASSRAVYGEGEWRRRDGSLFHPGQRSHRMLAAGQWDFPDSTPVPFRADRTDPRPTSVYGATKLAQEHVLRAWASAFNVKSSILRLQNVYGPGQSLSNPYTGIVTLFCRLAREGTSIPLYEDGEMTRDFVFIDDVVQAVLGCLRSPPEADRTLDVGSGEATSIRRVAETIARRYRAPAPRVSGAFREGDVRHASCDISPISAQLGFRPSVSLEQGLERLCAYIDTMLGGAS